MSEGRTAQLEQFAREYGDHNPLCRSQEDSRLDPKTYCDCGFIDRWNALFDKPGAPAAQRRNDDGRG